VILAGGLSVGRTSTDNCAVLQNAPDTNPVGRPYCHVDTALMGQTQVKLLGTYMIPKVGIQYAATFQSVPGPQVVANYLAPSADVQKTLGRPLSGGAPTVTVNLIAPGTMYGDRANQLDMRFGHTFKFGSRRASVNLDLYNSLNASPVIQENTNYASFRIPQRIMDGRLYKFSLQLDF